MKFAPIAVTAATAAALMPSASGYSIIRHRHRPLYRFGVPSVSSYVRALDRLLDDQVNFLDRQVATFDRQWDEMELALQKYTPRFDVAEQADKFQVSVDVPGFKQEDINVELVGDGTVLSISGTRKSDESSGRSFSSSFRQSFSLAPTVKIDDMTADLSDGVLTVSAPKDALVENKNRKIPLTMGSVGDSAKEEADSTDVDSEAGGAETDAEASDEAEAETEALANDDKEEKEDNDEETKADVVDLDKEEE